ncbi:chorismate-binding protein [Thermodesulfovibrio yellowstonii]|uniref:p-aminobenzoate synthetase n=1 Tax=Thermodesulfovibrio yellowstonii TaxID=28262 RepID=A0A9W6GBV9_9BACT|nr:anthranilate synthase component I family protein [Thermodesulfovibrio islandicus]GLI52313.1 p-aminobenzoate synthetase [Thermodesulfovibrio islandicus]
MLILCGSWIGKKGFYEVEIEELKFFHNLSEIRELEPLSFVIFSYNLSGETLDLKLKSTDLPSVIVIKIRKFKKINEKKGHYNLLPYSMSLKDSEFLAGIQKIRNLIEEGTVYQINLTNCFDFEFKGNPVNLFFRFYKNQPVPYGFFLNLGDFFIVSGSMELFLDKLGERIISKPIKGTSKSLKFLQNSYKDKAENLMITDMMRNDIGRVAEVGSVKVSELFKITKYRTLYQMHSTVEGITNRSIVEIIGETFPPASVTGAPKRKAVEIIELLEPHARGYYCGAAGLVRNDKDFTLSVLIRTAVGIDNHLSYYAGCGIVWDSVPERELEELYLKVKAFCPEELNRCLDIKTQKK